MVDLLRPMTRKYALAILGLLVGGGVAAFFGYWWTQSTGRVLAREPAAQAAAREVMRQGHRPVRVLEVIEMLDARVKHECWLVIIRVKDRSTSTESTVGVSVRDSGEIIRYGRDFKGLPAVVEIAKREVLSRGYNMRRVRHAMNVGPSELYPEGYWMVCVQVQATYRRYPVLVHVFVSNSGEIVQFTGHCY